MDVALDPLESLWPPYRGSVLLGAARESRGRVCNAGVAVTAGHVAVSLDVHPDRSTAAAAATTAATTATPTADSDDSGNERARQRGDDKPVPDAAAEAGVDGAMPSPSLRLTVLLDAVPASAPKPGTQQLARFLTKVLGRSAVGVVDGDGRGGSRIASRGRGGLLGADVPELLVVEHLDEVRDESIESAGRRLRQRVLGRVVPLEVAPAVAFVCSCCDVTGLMKPFLSMRSVRRRVRCLSSC